MDLLLTAFLPAMGLCLVLAASLRISRSINAATRYVLCWLVLVTVAVLPGLAMVGPQLSTVFSERFSSAGTLFTSADSQTSEGVAEESVKSTASRKGEKSFEYAGEYAGMSIESPEPAERQEIIPANTGVQHGGEESPNSVGARLASTETPSTSDIVWALLPGMALAVWLITALALLAQLGRAYFRARRLIADATPASLHLVDRIDLWRERLNCRRQVEVRVSDQVGSPAAVGFRHGTVLLPRQLMESLSEDELDTVLLHELVHLHRRDDRARLAEQILSRLLFFNPLIHWLVRQIDLQREIACDDWVLHLTRRPGRYARALARVVELQDTTRALALAPGMLLSKKQIFSRFEMILDKRRTLSTRMPRRALAVVMLVLTTAVFALWSVAPVIAVPGMQVGFADLFEADGFEGDAADGSDDLEPIGGPMLAAEPNAGLIVGGTNYVAADRGSGGVVVWDNTTAPRPAYHYTYVDGRGGSDFSDLRVSYKGRVRLSRRNTEIESISRSGFVEVIDNRDKPHRRLLIEPLSSGDFDYFYRENGQRAEFGSEAKEWLADILREAGPEMDDFVTDGDEVMHLLGRRDGRRWLRSFGSVGSEAIVLETPDCPTCPYVPVAPLVGTVPDVPAVMDQTDLADLSWTAVVPPTPWVQAPSSGEFHRAMREMNEEMREHDSEMREYAAAWAEYEDAVDDLDDLDELSELSELSSLSALGDFDIDDFDNITGSIFTDDEDGRHIILSDGRRKLAVSYDGEIELADDDRDLAGLSPGGYFEIEEREGRDRRRLLIESDRHGELDYIYFERGRQADFDDDAREWFGDVMLEAVRNTGIGAESRVKRIRDEDGVEGVLDEIGSLESDYVKRRYFTALLDSGPIDGDQMRSILTSARREIDSDYEKAELFIATTEYIKEPSEIADAYVDGVATLDSDYEIRRVLSAILFDPDTGELDDEVVDKVLRIADRLDSDYERAELLIDMSERMSPETEHWDAYLQAVGGIDSDYETRRVLRAMGSHTELTEEQAELILELAGELDSDYEKAELLIEYARATGDNERLLELYLEAAYSIDSDYEKRRVLSEIAFDRITEEALLLKILQIADDLDSDYERAELLISLSREAEKSPEVRSAYLKCAQGLTSDYDRSRVLQMILRQGEEDPDFARELLLSVEDMSSDYERAKLLRDMVDIVAEHEELEDDFVDVIESIGSEHERDRLYRALYRATGKR
jgi:beta-lactamase regulating signal transducer with metallopeptidase domain